MNYDLDTKVECEICKASVSKYLRFVHEAKCKLEQLTSYRNEISETDKLTFYESEAQANENVCQSTIENPNQFSKIKQNHVKDPLTNISINHNNDVIEPKFPLNKLFENIMKRINTDTSGMIINKSIVLHQPLTVNHLEDNPEITTNDEAPEEIKEELLDMSDLVFRIPKENETIQINKNNPGDVSVSDQVNYELSGNFNNQDNKETSQQISKKEKNNKAKEDSSNDMMGNKEFLESEPQAGTFQFHKKLKKMKDEFEISSNSDELNKEIEDSIIDDSMKLFKENVNRIINANTPLPLTNDKEKGEGECTLLDLDKSQQTEISKIYHSQSHFQLEDEKDEKEDEFITNQNQITHINSNLLPATNKITMKETVKLMSKNVKEKEKSSILSYIADDSLLQKIEQKQLETEKELQQTLDEIHQIESRLNLDERLMHDKWQIRKNAFKEISNLISTFVQYTSNSDSDVNSEEKLQMFETFSHWLKYFISDANITALAEGLNTFYVFITNAAEYRNKAMIDFFDEMEKIVSYSKPNINETSTKIINFCLCNKKMLNFTFNELIKKLTSNNNKILQFVFKTIYDFLTNSIGNCNEAYVKLIFEKGLFHYSTLSVSKNIEKKKFFAKMIQDLYSIIDDDVEVIKRNLKSINQKDLEKLLGGVKKKNSEKLEKKMYLYGSPESQSTSENKLKVIDNKDRRESNTKSIDIEAHNNNKNSNSNNQEKYNTSTNDNNSNPSNLNLKDSVGINQSSLEINDIVSFMPSEFFEIPYLPNYNTKKEILEKLNRNLTNVITVKNREKDHKEILSIINYAIEDSNMFVHLEGIKSLCHLARLLQNNINSSKLKLVVSLCFDKFKDKKSLVRNELFNLFDSLIINSCFSPDYFINFAVQYAANQKVATIKQHILDYVKLLLNEDESYLLNKHTLKEFINKIEINSYSGFIKFLVDIILTEPLSNIKDICTDILIKCKLQAVKTEECYEKFLKQTSSLPAYRSNIILSGNISSNKEEQSEKEYKMNLRRIKSNLSRGNLNPSRSRSKEVQVIRSNLNINNYMSDNVKPNAIISTTGGNTNKSVRAKRNSDSVSKNLGKENNLNKHQSSHNLKKIVAEVKYNSTSNNPAKNEQNNIKERGKIKNESVKFTEKKRLTQIVKTSTNINKSLNEIKQINNIEKNPSKNNISVIHKDLDASDTSVILNTDNSKAYSTNKSILEKRMESAIEHIFSLKKEELFEYTKKVIRDFLIFVQNVNNKKLNEDLASHFEVIFRILDKIFERISKIFKNEIPDELIIQSLKVIIVASCFINPESKNYDGEIIVKFLGMIRNLVKDDYKLCSFYIDVISKFINFENNSTSFLERVNPKWVFINFIEYVHENIQVNKLKCYDNLVELIETVDNSSLLTEGEKRQYLALEDNEKRKFDSDAIDATEYIMNTNLHHKASADLESSLMKDIKFDRDNYHDDCTNIRNVNKMRNMGSYIDDGNDLGKYIGDIDVDMKRKYYVDADAFNIKNNEEKIPEQSNDGQHGNIKTNIEWEKKNSYSYGLESGNLSSDINDNVIGHHKIPNKAINNNYTSNSDNKLDAEMTRLSKSKKSDLVEGEVKDINKIEDEGDNKIIHIENTGFNNNKMLNLPEDIIDIKDKIKQKMRKLDLTIQRLGNKIDTQAKEEGNSNESLGLNTEKSEKHIPTSNSSRFRHNNAPKQIRSLEDFYDEEKEAMENYPLINIDKGNSKHSADDSKLITVHNTSVLSNISSNSLIQHNHKDKSTIESEYRSLILKIPSNLLDNNLSEIILYVKLESIFSKISYKSKVDFILELYKILENTNLIKASSFNYFLQLFEFILTLLTNEMKLSYRYIHTDSVRDLNKQRHQEIILKLQQLIENLLRIKDLTEILKILVYLLKKYLPRDFSFKLDKDCMLYLKTICYLLKSSIEIKKSGDAKIRTYEILQEINDLFLTCPPTNLREGIPNLNELDKIYKLLKMLTDISVQSGFEEAKLFLSSSKKVNYKSQYCEIYLNYLDNVINNSFNN